MTHRDNDERERRTCLAHCVAWIMELAPDAVDLFVDRDDWVKSLRDWMREKGRGLQIAETAADLTMESVIAIHGAADATTGHAVVWERNGSEYRPAFDPYGLFEDELIAESWGEPMAWMQFPEEEPSLFAEWVRTCPRMSGNVLLVGAPSLPDRLLLCRAAESSCVITGDEMTSPGFEEWTKFLSGGGMDLVVLFEDVPRWHVLLRYLNNQGQARANFEMEAPAGWRHHRIQLGFHQLTRRR